MRGRRVWKRRDGVKRSVYLLPNLCTSASLFCGFYSVIKALSGDFDRAAWAILIAGIFDMLDGRLARLAKAESQFGIEYDSLSDLASFGFAPAILIYTWALQGMGKVGWLAAFLYFACGALRLARFNVQHDNVEHKHFQGLPIPIAAYVLASYVIFFQYFNKFPPQGSYLVPVVTGLLGLLMVTTIKYRSLKAMEFGRRNSFFMLVIAVIAMFVIAIKPEVVIFVLAVSYVASGLIEEAITLKTTRHFIDWLLEKDLDGSKSEGLSVVSGGARSKKGKRNDDTVERKGTGGVS